MNRVSTFATAVGAAVLIGSAGAPLWPRPLTALGLAQIAALMAMAVVVALTPHRAEAER